MAIDPKLVERIDNELREDLYNRWDGDFNAWIEVWYDCPSNSYVELFDDVEERDLDAYHVEVDRIIEELRVENQDDGSDNEEDDE